MAEQEKQTEQGKKVIDDQKLNRQVNYFIMRRMWQVIRGRSADDTIYGIMSGYDSQENLLEISSTNKDIENLEGSKVYTSGMGGIFPSGILIGEVFKIEEDKYEILLGHHRRDGAKMNKLPTVPCIIKELDDDQAESFFLDSNLQKGVDNLTYSERAELIYRRNEVLKNQGARTDLMSEEDKEKRENMRGEFLGNVSHELKTPIALIQGYAEGLKEGVNDDPESREFYCDVIMDEASKMNQMVKNLLTLNQLEFGDEDIVFDRFNLTALVRGVLQSMEIMADQAGAKILLHTEEDIYAWADEFKVEQVVKNYVSNACHHVSGDMVIEVKMVQKDGKVRVSVFNTGTPIPEADIAHIWDKFYKVDKAHTREYGGNGIGLSIVKAIMKSFHQEYGVKNYDNGVEFWFELDVQ